MTRDQALKAAAEQLAGCKHAGKDPCEMCEPLKVLMDAAGKLTNVEALLPQWRIELEEIERLQTPNVLGQTVAENHIDDLERALRGDPW